MTRAKAIPSVCPVCGRSVEQLPGRGRPRLACPEHVQLAKLIPWLETELAQVGPSLPEDAKRALRGKLWSMANELNRS